MINHCMKTIRYFITIPNIHFKKDNCCILASVSIRYVQHMDINFSRWDDAIASARNAMVYAESWFLNATTDDHWDALIEGDYSAVMPLPFNRKLLGYHQIFQPFFTQQLGVFSKSNEIDVQPFIDAIPHKFKRLHYHFNHQNDTNALDTKTNLVVDLNRGYDEIESQFSKSLRKRIRQNEQLQLWEKGDVGELIRFYKEALETKVQLGAAGYALAERLFTEAIQRKAATIYQLIDKGNIIACGIFFHKHGRLINVFAASDASNKNAMSVFLARIMEKHSNSDVLFDFEGSEIPGIQQYFKSFGSVEQNYPVLRKNELPFWVKIVRPN